MTLEQWYLDLPLHIKFIRGFWWDKHPEDHLHNQQVGGWDRKEEDYIRGWPPWKRGDGIWEKKKELLVLWINLNKYKNFSSSDLIEESYSFQIVFSYLFSTNPIHCDLDIIYWVFYLWNPFSNKYIVFGLLGHNPFPLDWRSKSSPYTLHMWYVYIVKFC